MYCERCGKQIEEALNFCNSCGAQLKKGGESYRTVIALLVVALGVVAIGGLGTLAGILAILLDRISQTEPIVAFSVFYLAAWFGLCFMIMRQISKLIDANLAGKIGFGSGKAQRTEQPAVQLPPKSTAQLEEFRQPASVVENTTRTLDKVPR